MTAQEVTTATLPTTVLVVEDDALIRMDLAHELRQANYNVIEACDADEAVALLEAGVDVDVLLTDIDMPGSRDGVAFARIVRQQLPQTCIVIMSAHRHTYEDGLADAKIEKPYVTHAVLAEVAALLGRAKGDK